MSEGLRPLRAQAEATSRISQAVLKSTHVASGRPDADYFTMAPIRSKRTRAEAPSPSREKKIIPIRPIRFSNGI